MTCYLSSNGLNSCMTVSTFQYVPLPVFFAEDKLSFYKVMSDTQGYKHIHYVKDVGIIHLQLGLGYASGLTFYSLMVFR